MRNNKERTRIGCSLRPFDCQLYKHPNLCNKFYVDCIYAIKIKIKQPSKLELINEVTRLRELLKSNNINF